MDEKEVERFEYNGAVIIVKRVRVGAKDKDLFEVYRGKELQGISFSFANAKLFINTNYDKNYL